MPRASAVLPVLIALLLPVAGAGASTGAARPAAAGAPGARAIWTPADKHGFGTAHSLDSRVWFTLRRSELTEVYWPDLGTPAIRDLEFVVSGGGRVEREQSVRGAVSLADPRSLTYEQVTETPRWRLTKTIVTDPARDVVLLDVDFTSRTGGPLAVHVLLDPALSNDGDDDRGRTAGSRLVAWDADGASALAAAPALRESSSGYRGERSDAWADLRRDGDLDDRTDAHAPGNVLQAARTVLDGRARRRMTVALGFGRDAAAAQRAARASLADGFAFAAQRYAGQWDAWLGSLATPPRAVAAHRGLYDQSLMLLDASEDKTHRGAGIASPSMPWAWGLGTIEKEGSAPYHLVWGRDLYQVSTALLAAGDRAGAQRALDFLLFRQQKPDGSFPQNSQVDGEEKWEKIQLDQTAFPLVMAWQLSAFDARRWARLRRAADFLVRTGPRSQQERWENQSGWSPGTIAAEIAGLVCAADIARRNGDAVRAARYEYTADAWAGAVERWTVTRTGPLSPRPYYLRVTKERAPDRADPYNIGDSGPSEADQRRVVDPSFLELVRLGIKRPDDPVILNTLDVVDRVLGVDTPHGRLWHRFTYDGYGERRDGGPWEIGTPNERRTFGRAWPIFAGERGEYELLAGRPDAAEAHLRTIAGTANGGGMLPEQVWDGRPPTGTRYPAGEGTFSATPLAWTHAQFVRLAWSIDAGAPVELPSIVACRYTGRSC